MIQIITIDAVGPSLNEFFGGGHFSKRHKVKQGWEVLVSQAVKHQGVVPVRVYPVTIDCRLTFGPGARSYDWENASATVKCIQDGLRKCGILEDDGMKYITGGRMWCVRGDRTMTQFAIREGKDAHKYG